ncbi:hypothetical protein OQ279_00535 [Salinimicrobium sp. MT39]|uniref:O-Glycosyl hydrolase n=1 Tax=Salinimicrobium profundisediminis TaxID=2994553 RepID=A0A9X3CTM4_9FLAO|nr:hypothetical protein [Salinimicrobium profundisediminis]MCX2836621.1 hypothetical protein [Salinimicrobium profundisediminis]
MRKFRFDYNLQKYLFRSLAFSAVTLLSWTASAQAEFTTWGNMTGIRVDNQLMEFNSSLAVENQWGETWRTRKEGQEIDFKREGPQKVFSYQMKNLKWTQAIETLGDAKAEVEVTFVSPKDTLLNAAYFTIDLPKEFGPETTFSFVNSGKVGMQDLQTGATKADYKAPAQGMTIESPTRKLVLTFAKPAEVIINREETAIGNIRLNFVLASGEIKAKDIHRNTFIITASGEIDRSPVVIKVFPEQEGKAFDGIGGNFRLQNAATDPQVIDFTLKNLNVTWGRVEMPWQYWHQNENEDPAAQARKGQIHPKVKAAMEMAQKLDQMNIPVMLAAWFPPDWAIIGKRFKGKHPDGSMGNKLDLTKSDKIYRSLVSYIKYLKEEYGVETVMFSFNESDLGIDVQQTDVEHNQLIKTMGSLLRAEGLQTEFLLGDTADANGWDFTTLASTDPESLPYIGGVSFHSWRGYTEQNLLKWKDISNRVDEPLFIGEGSIDAGAWRYPQIFEEPTYALEEIDVYIKMMNIAQPISILQWQLTADYSVMSGGGIFGNHEDELYPTQRFFNLKQLSNTPEGLFYLPVKVDKEGIRAAALGDESKGSYVIHLVNKGATRNVKLTGLPKGLKTMNLHITNLDSSFKKLKNVKVQNGTAEFSLEGASFVSLFSNKK